ncbi:hypothetical protein BJY04DRAFT_201152 [Aspergillus karnatakaensis]|uniref:uncharacterized protein n=1 Tax=Aspergillus karnatakaensis TaxID=1810916 RepID=UPI003CCE1918
MSFVIIHISSVPLIIPAVVHLSASLPLRILLLHALFVKTVCFLFAQGLALLVHCGGHVITGEAGGCCVAAVLAGGGGLLGGGLRGGGVFRLL